MNIPFHMTLQERGHYMLTNPGFSFSGISGIHKIVPTTETKLPIWGENYTEAIVCSTEGNLVKVYDNGPGFNYTDKSVAMEFAAINPNDRQSILNFCNHYGMPGSIRQAANLHNDYLFSDSDKESFSKEISLGNEHECDWLYTVQRDILQVQLTIELNQSIQDQNPQRIIEILLYFCFDLYGLDFKNSQRASETYQFNHFFYRYAEKNGFSLLTRLSGLSIHRLITGFLDDITNDYNNSLSYPDEEKYPLFSFPTWQHLHNLFSFITQKIQVLNISPWGDVTFSSSLSDLVTSFCKDNINEAMQCAKIVFSDIFKEHLHRIYPEIIFTKEGNPESSWRIPSLIDAMYLELFFRFSPNSNVRKCQNPDCPNYFTWTSSRSKKIYCSQSCALLMAKRKQRERDRIAARKKNNS